MTSVLTQRRPSVDGVRLAVTAEELALELAALRSGGATVALVPTMGALHHGHRRLIARARELADAVVVSVFVNPLQFGPGEDLEHYPRTLAADLLSCAAEGAHLVWAPEQADVYPGGRPLVSVTAGPLGAVLCGASRPGHFDGVLTVVTKLFSRIRPEVAVFGEKDAQQLLLVRRLVADLDLGVDVVGVPIDREADGLARSSRNTYLSPSDRERALALSRALVAGRRAAALGPTAVLAAARAQLDGLEVEYCELVDPQTLGPARGGAALLLVAARVGSTRLIDNERMHLPAAAR